MIQVRGLYMDDLEFNDNKLYGLFSLDKSVINNLLLILAGINNTKGKVFYNNEPIYDNEKYFKSRIYLDCKQEYFQTIKPLNIAKGILRKFNKLIDVEKLTKHLKTLDVRGECEITSVYHLTPCGNTLVNLSVLLSCSQDLLINNPTINIKTDNDIKYLVNEICQLNTLRILGLNNLSHFKNKLDCLYLFTPSYQVVKIIPQADVLYLVDKNNAFLSLFDANNNKMIVKGLTNDELKYCDRNKISYHKINIYELEKYI